MDQKALNVRHDQVTTSIIDNQDKRPTSLLVVAASASGWRNMAEIHDGKCYREKADHEGPSLYSNGNLTFQAHHVGWLVATIFTLISCVASFWLINKHLQWYTNVRCMFSDLSPCFTYLIWQMEETGTEIHCPFTVHGSNLCCLLPGVVFLLGTQTPSAVSNLVLIPYPEPFNTAHPDPRRLRIHRPHILLLFASHVHLARRRGTTQSIPSSWYFQASGRGFPQEG